MATIPLAWLVSVLTVIAAVALALNPRLPEAVRLFLALFLMSLAITAGLLGLRLTYGVLWAGRIQPHAALMIAPLAFLGFRGLTSEGGGWRWRTLWPDLVALGLVQAMVALRGPVPPDLLIALLSLVYLLRLGLLLRAQGDRFVHVPPGSLGLWRAAMFASLALLAVLMGTDLVISLALMTGGEGQLRGLLTGASGVFVACVLVIALIGVPLVLRRRGDEAGVASVRQTATPEDEALLTRLDALMRDARLYADNAMTLARVARRLGVPARDVSGAVNRVRRQNFSRYVNAHRIAHARDLLEHGDLSVTDIMLEAGFVSKSSFNAEFRRITGKTPTAYRLAVLPGS